MGLAKRLSYGFIGLILILCSLIMICIPEDGYEIVLLVLEIALIVYGIKQILYYFLMARHMVGGIRIFYQSVLILDAGLFALSLQNMPRQYVMLYLIGGMLISGVIDAAHARETKQQNSPHWKNSLFSGLVKIVLSVVCLFRLDSAAIITIIYSAELFYSGLVRIVTAFRRTAMVYVP